MSKPKRPKIRLNLDCSPETRQIIERILQRTNAESRSEVIRKAISLYDFLTSQRESAAAIVIKQSDGTEQQIIII